MRRRNSSFEDGRGENGSGREARKFIVVALLRGFEEGGVRIGDPRRRGTELAFLEEAPVKVARNVDGSGSGRSDRKRYDGALRVGRSR